MYSPLTDTHGAVRGGLEAVGTDAAIAPQRVDTLAGTAHTGVLQTLVAIWEQGSRQADSYSRWTLQMNKHFNDCESMNI